ncbi:MAG TPA: MIP/aquaporin family protein [Trueperaceae bacterium]|nr:MIP/aquaporin family protein [Trueperaceae bacterium]
MRAYLMEFIGTFFLVFTIGLVVIQGVAMAPLAIGFALMVMVYAGGHVSGGHYNPAVSLGAVLRGALPMRELLPYWISQVLGALVAAWIARVVAGGAFTVAPGPDAGWLPALLTEFLFTFALVMVVLASATAKDTNGNSFYGLAIGGTVAVGAFAGGAISGGAFNPAVGIGPIVVDAFAGGGVGQLWLYIVGPLLGGVLAAAVFPLLHPEG